MKSIKLKITFKSEIKENKAVIKKLNKYITGFDYTDKVLIVLSATFSGVSSFSHLKIKMHTGLISSVLILVLFFNYNSNKKKLLRCIQT